MINLEIDGKQVQVENGSTVMEAANKLGVFVPHFCYHKKLSIAANCRMCLVQVEKAPKPLPACATPATEGMKVQTSSEYAKKAQEGVMEFLLINHPLDCPICDQGGECQLQDLAVGYGNGASRYQEEKRVVVNKNLGPLISTDMTRCIHCTRCVRFGQEIAGVMELGQAGRGEHSEILAFVGKTVDSELSGNVIDLCPVGALTSKPFRYSARTWELSRRKSVSPHDGLGSNLIVQVKQDRVMRVLPLENEAINECWLSDKDRFSYEGLNSPERLTKPMVKTNGAWAEAEWPEALQASPHQTLEELYLLNKVVRGLGSNNVDTRLRRTDTRAAGKSSGAPWLGMKITDIASLKSVLIIGSTLRKDHPLIANRFRQAAKKGLQINLVHSVDDDLLMTVANKAIVRPSAMALTLAAIAKSMAEIQGSGLATEIAAVINSATVSNESSAIAKSLLDKEKTAILLGNFAQHQQDASTLHVLAQEIARLSGATVGFLGEAANSVGSEIVNANTSTGALSGAKMAETPLQACLLLGVEPELDCSAPVTTINALKSAEFVVALSAFQTSAIDYANVILPIAPFTETAGTFVNTEGVVQKFNGVVKPLGEARPAWKVIRVLGNMLGLDGFNQDNVDAIRNEIAPDLQAFVNAKLNNEIRGLAITLLAAATGIERIAEVPIYAADALVRRAASLQKSADAKSAKIAFLASDVFANLGLSDGADVRVAQGAGAAILKAKVDATLPAGCARVAAAISETWALDAMFGAVTVEKISLAAAAD
jgi:NADH-quinone oxidoreductase subunit G